MKKVAGTLRIDLSQYRELQAFAQFGTEDLDAATRRQLNRGARLTELLKQPQFQPLSLGQQVSILFAGVSGLLDDVPVEKILDFEKAFHEHMSAGGQDLINRITTTGELTEDDEAALRQAISDFKASVAY
jgi:F-type H+-transporting ATPase subunit alpha